MIREANLLKEFRELKEQESNRNNELALKYINLYISICEKSINSNVPISEMSLDNFETLINTLKENYAS